LRPCAKCLTAPFAKPPSRFRFTLHTQHCNLVYAAAVPRTNPATRAGKTVYMTATVTKGRSSRDWISLHEHEIKGRNDDAISNHLEQRCCGWEKKLRKRLPSLTEFSSKSLLVKGTALTNS
jgi:hypothetical protein